MKWDLNIRPVSPALAVTSHPDLDDTPLYDENGDGNRNNDGDLWHTHWVVLKPNEVCGPGALAVVDIPEGQKPRLPKTGWFAGTVGQSGLESYADRRNCRSESSVR